MKSRIVVLGADGFIGRHVVAALDASAWAQAVPAGRRPAAPMGAVHGARLQLDATDANALEAALQGADAVVNCIAGSARTIEDSSRALFAVAQRLRQAPVIVHLSSMAVYGSAEGDIDESAPLRADLGPYASAKIASEQLARQYERRVVLRPGIVYGPGGALWSALVGRLLLARRLGDLGAAGAGICSLVYVEDLVAAVLQALRRPAALGLTLNLAAPAAPTWNEYFARYAAALHATPVRNIGPWRLQAELRVAGPALKLGEVLLRAAGRPVDALPPSIRPWLLAQCRHRIGLQSQRAQQALGLEWTPLDAGLRRTADWLLGACRPAPGGRATAITQGSDPA